MDQSIEMGHADMAGYQTTNSRLVRLRPHILSMGLLAVAAVFSPPARSQGTEAVGLVAISLSTYEATKEACFYEQVVGEALNEMARYFAKTQPYEWRRAQRESTGSSQIASNMARLLTGNSPGPKPTDCDVHANSVFAGLQFGLLFATSNPELPKALQRLSKGGRSSGGAPPEAASNALQGNADPSRADLRFKGSIVVNCTKVGDVSVCRPSRGKMVWCKGAYNLSALEAEVAKSPRDNDSIIRETGGRWGCGISSGSVLNSNGANVGRVEDRSMTGLFFSESLFHGVN